MKPTQFGKAYAQAMVSCSPELGGYGRCVASKARSEGASGGVVEQGSCAKEFQQLLRCFEKVREGGSEWVSEWVSE